MIKERNLPFAKLQNGLCLYIRLTPNANQEKVVELVETPDGPALKVKVRAIAEKGKANTALIETIAKWLGVARSGISLTAGQKSRTKKIRIDGDTESLSALLENKFEEFK